MTLPLLTIIVVVVVVVATNWRLKLYRVIKVYDGDSIHLKPWFWQTQDRLLEEGVRSFKTRLYGIQCPELDEKLGHEARLYMSQLTQGKLVRVRFLKREKYGRFLVIVRRWGFDVGRLLIRKGLGSRYLDDKHYYAVDERRAKQFRKGIWKKL